MPLFGKKDGVRGSGSAGSASSIEQRDAAPPKRVSIQLASPSSSNLPVVQWASNSVILHVCEAAPGDGFDADGEKVVKLKGDTFVMAWLVDDEGQPVGHPARWPKRSGVYPVWNSSREVGPIVASAKWLRVELWEQQESGMRRFCAGPAEVALDQLPYETTRLAFHNRVTSSVKLQVLRPVATMMRKQIFFVRHGESKWNAAKKAKNVYAMVREHDHPLNEEGYRQASHAYRISHIVYRVSRIAYSI